MSEIINMNEAGIDEEKDYVEDEEMIVRLLSSPKLYDTDTCRLNAAAFNLRTLRGKNETYVSLGRERDMDNGLSGYLERMPNIIWGKSRTQDYVGYIRSEAAEYRKDFPLNALFSVLEGSDDHAGLFFLTGDKRQCLAGPIDKSNADELKYYLVILELCERLEPFVILKKHD